jgi:uncharacterized protein YkwD
MHPIMVEKQAQAPREQDTMSHGLRLNESTKKRLTEIALQRKKSQGTTSKDRKQGKEAVFNAAGKWGSPFEDAAAEEPPKKPKKKKSTLKKGGDLNLSEHTGTMKKKASMPPDDEERVSPRDDVRPKSPGTLKKRSQSPGALKKRVPREKQPSEGLSPPKKERSERSSSAGPLKRRPRSQGALKKRSSSPGPLKKRTESPGPMKRKTSIRGRSTRAIEDPERTSRPGDTDGKLGDMLGNLTGTKPKKKGSRSVASAPVVRSSQSSKETGTLQPRSRRSSRGVLEGSKGQGGSRRERLRTVDLDDAFVTEVTPKQKPRRAYSADEADFGDLEEDVEYTWDGEQPTGRMSTKMSRKVQNGSPHKKTSENGSDKTSSTHEGDSSSVEHEPKEDLKASRRASLRAKIKKGEPVSPMKRVKSMQTRPTLQRPPAEKTGPPPVRAQSMMSNREETRRGKQNSLANLINYSEEEIHSTSYFASNHVLVNRERMKRGLRPLTRNIAMDDLAREHSQNMADHSGVTPIQTTYVGNVLRGESIRSIHRATMQQKDGRERYNLLNPFYQDFGVGTAKGEDGMLYVCQLFSERLELSCTNVAD